MSLIQLIYTSRPFGFDDARLASILMEARRYNARDDITGALIVREDLYLQMLEGPEKAVDATFHRIKNDDRHVEVTLLMRQPANTRLFPDWSMRDDPADSWMWSQEQVKAGAIAQATEDEALGIFKRLAADDAA